MGRRYLTLVSGFASGNAMMIQDTVGSASSHISITCLWRWTVSFSFSHEYHPLDKHVVTRHCSDSDEFYVEDVTYHGRVQLPEHLVAAVKTGLVVSARGVSTCEGDFQVQRQMGFFS